MLSPNYETLFNTVSGKILRKQNVVTDSLANGQGNSSSLLNYNVFIMLSIIDSINSSDTDTNTMNLNLNYLQRIWAY